MINSHEIETFDFLYNFVHEHDEGIYQITFQDGTEVSAEYDTDYETDNGLDIDDAKYEEYIAIVFKNSIDGTLFEVSCFRYYNNRGEFVMNIAVRYYSKGGNTRKIAEAIAKAVGTEAKTVSEPLTEDMDILFLGSAPYAFDVDNAVKNFIRNINVSVGKVVNFSTTAVIRSTRKYVEKLFAEKKIPVAKEEFSCRGAFAVLHKGRPNEDDLRSAADFAGKIIS